MQNLPVYFVIAAIVAFLDILPPFYQGRPGRYCLHVFLQYFFTGIVVFSMALPQLPWWSQGSVIALCLLLPTLVVPMGRGSFRWHHAVINAVIVGVVLSVVKYFLSDIARSFT